MTKNFRLVPAAVFIYDCSRFLFLLMLLSFFLKSMPELQSVNLPLMMYAAPNALFPLMAFFLLFRFDISKAYIPLYITGKTLALLCMFIWLFFALQQIFNVFRVLWAVFFCAADLGTIMGMAMRNEEVQSSQEITVEVAEAAAEAAEGGE